MPWLKLRVKIDENLSSLSGFSLKEGLGSYTIDPTVRHCRYYPNPVHDIYFEIAEDSRIPELRKMLAENERAEPWEPSYKFIVGFEILSKPLKRAGNLVARK